MAQLRVSDAMAPLMESSGPTATLDEITLAFEGDPDPIALVVRENGGIHGIITDLRLTEDAVIVAVRHPSATLIPRGHTRLAAGDRVTIIAAAGSVAEVRATFEGRP